jgi:hypothetical protein
MPILRDDLSARLVHLTRGDTLTAAVGFFQIVRERRLRGGTTDIRGGFRCVCFSEAPIGKLAHLLADPSVEGMRYKPFGVMVDKAWLFAHGGRPVIYQPESEYTLLHESQRYRHVRYEPPETDHTWEREWRVRIDELPLDPAAVTLVVPTRKWERWFQAQHVAMLSRRAMLLGMVGPKEVAEFPWHFTVLEDVGVDIAIDVETPPGDAFPSETE